jgi:hypothetical protein
VHQAGVSFAGRQGDSEPTAGGAIGDLAQDILDLPARSPHDHQLEFQALGRRRPLAVPGLVIASQSLCGGRTRTVRHQGGGYRVAHGGKMLMPPQFPC